MPFKDKEFDYAISNQVLEHVDNPLSFISEIQRVARQGYIETPSLIGEYLFPKKSHKWVILDIDNKLVMYEKALMPGNYDNDYGELFLNYLPFQSLAYKLLWLTEGDITLNRYEWKDSIDVIVNPTDEYYLSFFTKKWDRAMVEKLYPPRSVSAEIIKTIKGCGYMIKSELRNIPKKKRVPMLVSDYMKLHEEESSK